MVRGITRSGQERKGFPFRNTGEGADFRRRGVNLGKGKMRRLPELLDAGRGTKDTLGGDDTFENI